MYGIIVNQAILVGMKLLMLGYWNKCTSPSEVELVTGYTTGVELFCMITMLGEDLWNPSATS